jgi:hypothetical protein
MNPWKNATLVLSGMLLGACAGAFTARAVAYAPNPGAPRWEQMCEVVVSLTDAGWAEHASEQSARRGAEGWELVAVNKGAVCFKRPAPAAAAN